MPRYHFQVLSPNRDRSHFVAVGARRPPLRVVFSLPGTCYGRQGPRKCYFQLDGFKSKGARFALVCNAALRVDQVNAIRPACVRPFRRIAELVEHGRKFDPKFSYAGPGDQRSLFFSLRAGKNNLVFNIALRLPNVAGMRFGNVDHQERNPPAILLVKLIKGRNLPPERRSRVAAEHQNHGLPLV
jgi:hypothetical protein